jgi:DNA primase
MPALRKKEDVMVLEGYMDVVVSHQFGSDNTVATLGTALTQQQSHMLKRYSDRVILMFDSDSAGENAARRAIETLLETELPITVAAMPEGVDPDEYLLEHGKDEFSALVKTSSMPAEEFLVSQARKVYGLKTPDSKVKAAEGIIPYLEKIKNPVLRSEWIKYISERIGISEDSFLAEWNRRKKTQGVKRFGQQNKSAVPVPGNVRSAEEEIIQLVCACPELLFQVKEEYFKDERNRNVIELLIKGVGHSKIVEGLTETDANWLTELMLEKKTYANPTHTLSNILKDIKRGELEVQRKKFESEVNKMLSGQIPVDDYKLQKYNDLNKQLKGSVQTDKEQK